MTVDTGERGSATRSERRGRAHDGSRRGSDRVRRTWLDWEVGSTSLRGWRWATLFWAVGTVIVSLGLALAVAHLVGGEAGRTVGATVYAVAGGAVAAVFVLRNPPRGLFRLRGVDVLFAFVAGLVLPFVAGGIAALFGDRTGWPALGALSPRWLALGAAAPLLAAVLGQLVANAFLLVSVFSISRRRGLSRLTARLVAGAAGFVALLLPAVLLSGDLSRQPLALPVSLALVSAASVVVTGRIWGALLLAAVFQTVWIALSAIGVLLS